MSRPMTSFSLVILLACGAPSLAPEDGALATPRQESVGLQPSGPRVGDACAPDCIWSGDAITVGAQEPTENCSGAPCACVLVGDTDQLCVAGADAGMPPDAGAVDASAPKTPANAVPYFCQYDNALHPGASCQNTSVAMVLASLGWQGHPDDITREWGKDYAQSPVSYTHLRAHET